MINCSVFILIGGESKRFGSTKYLEKINGDPIISRVIKACENFTSYTLVGKNLPSELENKSFIEDKHNIKAPIIGLQTALKYSSTKWILLLSSDLPLINKSIFTKMWRFKNSKKNIIIPVVNGTFQTTCAFYNTEIRNECMKQINKKRLSLMNLVNKIGYFPIDFSNEPHSFLNVNTKKDLSMAKKILISKKY